MFQSNITIPLHHKEDLSSLSPTPLDLAILKTIVYFDLFNYPVTLSEIHHYLSEIRATIKNVQTALRESPFLQERIARAFPFYYLKNRQNLVSIRLKRQEYCQKKWPNATKIARLLSHLPFVRMVALTGSFVMENADETGDIDFYIVTDTRCVWFLRFVISYLCRVISRFGTRLCPNYFTSVRSLDFFSEHSLCLAHDLLQMKVLYGHSLYHELAQQNQWVFSYLPNASFSRGSDIIDKKGWISRGVEHIIPKWILSALNHTLFFFALKWFSLKGIDPRIITRACSIDFQKSFVYRYQDIQKGFHNRLEAVL